MACLKIRWARNTSTGNTRRKDHTSREEQRMLIKPAQLRDIKPPPSRRRLWEYCLSSGSIYTWILILLTLSTLCQPIQAAVGAERTEISTAQNAGDGFSGGELIFETRPSPNPILYRRAAATSAAAASSSIISDTSPSSTSLPRAFDGGIGTNYTQPSCPTFLNSMISNTSFVSCIPFSLLIQNSQSFFDASRSLSTIQSTLTASCNVVYTQCSALMSSYASTLHSNNACLADYNLEQPMVRQAFAGLIAYDVLYKASCIKSQNSSDNNYCFADAVTNLTKEGVDTYPYYLPLGISLPASSLPTCDGCLKDVFAVFAAEASNKSQPLSLDYVSAAQLVNQDCGPQFVNGTIPDVGSGGSGDVKSSAAAIVPTIWGGISASTLAFILGVVFLLFV